jgi:hypothetical protein
MTYPATALTYGSYAYLKSEVGTLLGFGRNEATWNHEQRAIADTVVQRGVRAFYLPPPLPKEKYGHEWSFLRPVLSLSLAAPYSTGTVTIVDGVVTLAAGTFPSWAEYGEIDVDGSSYEVDSRDGDTQVTLEDTTVDADAESDYTLTRVVYALPGDFAMLDGPLTFKRNETVLYDPIEIVSEFQVRQRLQDTTTTGTPRIAAIRAAEDNAGYEIIFWPIADSAYTLEYLARINPAALSDSNTMPYGGTQHLQTVVESCRAEAEAEPDYKGQRGYYASRYLERLIASVSQDRKVTCPETLGFPRDPYRRGSLDWHDLDNNLLTPRRAAALGGADYDISD